MVDGLLLTVLVVLLLAAGPVMAVGLAMGAAWLYQHAWWSERASFRFFVGGLVVVGLVVVWGLWWLATRGWQ